MPKCDFNDVAFHVYSPVNLLHIFRTIFLKNTSGGLLLYRTAFCGTTNYLGHLSMEDTSLEACKGDFVVPNF